MIQSDTKRAAFAALFASLHTEKKKKYLLVPHNHLGGCVVEDKTSQYQKT
jgi:hypothetical protein